MYIYFQYILISIKLKGIPLNNIKNKYLLDENSTK